MRRNSALKSCGHCKTILKKPRWCPCKNAMYCNRECQKKHWKVHKKEFHNNNNKTEEKKKTSSEIKVLCDACNGQNKRKKHAILRECEHVICDMCLSRAESKKCPKCNTTFSDKDGRAKCVIDEKTVKDWLRVADSLDMKILMNELGLG